jgi:60 kDa SS-A/Ro ribonucleoprotein
MAPHIGLTALIRNLGNMTEVGSIAPMKVSHVVDRLKDKDELRRSRVHPFSILQTLAVYRSGHGVRGGKSWSPVPQVIDALDGAFYDAFANVEATGKRIMLALDVSGSMTRPMGGSPLSCREASAALALVTLATEPNTSVVGFTAGPMWAPGLTPLSISARQRLDDVVRTIDGLPFGATDCAQPMLHATQNNMEVDAFIIYTDSETWAGRIHPFQALQEYRRKTGINAKCVVVGMTSNGFSIADPNDGGMLDIVGFDASCPALISDFIKR